MSILSLTCKSSGGNLYALKNKRCQRVTDTFTVLTILVVCDDCFLLKDN